MTTSTPLISLAGTSSPVSVAQELGLGLTTQISMNDAAVRTLAGAGGSGTVILMSDLSNKSNVTFPSPVVTSGADFENVGSSASITFNTDGTISYSYTTLNTGTLQSRWCDISPPATYYIRGRYISTSGTGSISGDLSGGSTNTWTSWLALSSSRSAVVSASGGFTKSATFQFELARNSDGSNAIGSSGDLLMTGDLS